MAAVRRLDVTGWRLCAAARAAGRRALAHVAGFADPAEERRVKLAPAGSLRQVASCAGSAHHWCSLRRVSVRVPSVTIRPGAVRRGTLGSVHESVGTQFHGGNMKSRRMIHAAGALLTPLAVVAALAYQRERPPRARPGTATTAASATSPSKRDGPTPTGPAAQPPSKPSSRPSTRRLPGAPSWCAGASTTSRWSWPSPRRDHSQL